MSKRKVKNNCTVSQIAQCWLEDIRISVKESTYTRYWRITDKYILPHLGNVQIVEIDCLCINRFTENMLSNGGMRQTGLAPKTVTDVLCVLKSILKFARQQGYECASLDGVRFPQRRARNVSILTAESRELLESLVLYRQDSTSVGVLLSLFTGLRIGEVCGLKWSDIDTKAQLLHIRRTVERILDLDPDAVKKTKIVVSEPKTANSLRVIPLPAFLGNILADLAGEHDTYILTGTEKPMEPHCFYLRYRRFMEKNEIGGYSFHALRHTFATRCVEVGFDTKSLSEILGHSNVSTTLSFYVHPSIEQKRAQMEKLNPISVPAFSP